MPAFPLASLPADVFTTPIPKTIHHVQVAKECIAKLAANDISVFASSTAHWRDLLAMTSTLRTFTSGPAAGAAWKDTTSLHKPSGFEFKQGSARVVNTGPLSFIEARFSYTNGLQPRGRCLGLVKIAPEALQPGKQEVEYKIWALTTMLESVDGYGDPDVFPPHLIGKKTLHHRHRGTINGDKETKPACFDALVVGLGPSGLATLARLKALNLNAIACDRISQVGMNWTDRYQSLRLHTPKAQST